MSTSALTEQNHPADFVDRDSVVRRIWGDANMVLLIFAGSAAEFALNRAVDWLFFTGNLPRDPIGRLFSTAGYSQQIVFADVSTASRTLDRIRAVHHGVERQRGQSIPDWAHRDVLYMLIDYSERAHQLLARPLTPAEQHDLYEVFYRVGAGLRIPGLPQNYTAWKADRDRHLRRDLIHSNGTKELLAQYRNHLGGWRYSLLLRIQAILTPDHVRCLLGLKPAEWLRPLFRVYPILMRARLSSIIQRLLMPSKYLSTVRGLNYAVTMPSEHPTTTFIKGKAWHAGLRSARFAITLKFPRRPTV
ncbi:MAG TPA: oxygenase MpaB family protein [Gemmatimonadaceae bacterium]|nr:oxygenase MpaB family protein [Gemmatimonadaceae bacterium]